AYVTFIAGFEVNRVRLGQSFLFAAGAADEGNGCESDDEPFRDWVCHVSCVSGRDQILRFLNSNSAPASGIAHQRTRPNHSPPAPGGRAEPRLRPPLS